MPHFAMHQQLKLAQDEQGFSKTPTQKKMPYKVNGELVTFSSYHSHATD
jgi:hypothetical protein